MSPFVFGRFGKMRVSGANCFLSGIVFIYFICQIASVFIIFSKLPAQKREKQKTIKAPRFDHPFLFLRGPGKMEK